MEVTYLLSSVKMPFRKWIPVMLIILLLAMLSVFGTSYASSPNANNNHAFDYIRMLAGNAGATYELKSGSVPIENPIIPKDSGSVLDPLEQGGTLGQDFMALEPFNGITIETPSSESGAVTFKMTLYKDGPSGTEMYTAQVTNSEDGINTIAFPNQEPGRYYAEISLPSGPIGWLNQPVSYMMGAAYKDGQLLLDTERVLSLVYPVQASAGQTFHAERTFNEVLLKLPPSSQNGNLAVQLHQENQDGRLLVESRVEFDDPGYGRIKVGNMPQGNYYVEIINNGSVAFQLGLGSAPYDEGIAYLNGIASPETDLAIGYGAARDWQQWDTQSGTWVATDQLGRTVSTNAAVGPPDKDKFVGMFYFLWMGYHSNDGPYDITKILDKDPDALQNANSPLWGPEGRFHYWGESLFGYYKPDDEYVLRKHAQMLSDAGVDTLIFDTTNSYTYTDNFMALLRVFTEVRNEGGRTPQVAFLAPFGDASKVTESLWNDLYGPGLYSDLWFRWDGKPLIMADPNTVRADLRDFFTFRKPMPSYFDGPSGPNQWGWLEVSPQHVFYDAEGNQEQMTVGVGQNAVPNGSGGWRLGAMSEPGAMGRSFHNGAQSGQPYPSEQGLNFAEQWENALAADPEFVFVTGWNEWIAQRFSHFNGAQNPVMFVDQFNQEFSRDIEPMKGGHGDNYYYQLVDYIRKYKGTDALPAAQKKNNVKIDGKFKDWDKVSPEYRDNIGDEARRNHPGVGTSGQYVNDTGRNDIISAKVAFDNHYVYFYVRTSEAMTPYTDPNWMHLFIDADQNHATGWEGYDFRVNKSVASSQKSLLQASVNGTDWQDIGQVEYRVSGSEMEIEVPRSYLELNKKDSVQLDFKWADNMQQENEITEFTVNGDSAPNDRFNYRFEGK
ncbi:hypothetical protein [Paenibacillus spongiae]|uniref:Uncharacterized protein n=1 Tax=Paenibacillus spongiae TaxID=2909671 RepID=A0ABY5S266_9BACL|nr:hypothetical protein [Paenibacillus spongiae]UVI27967.1 hypothetical protein L1F29_21235 [Paenibacillus spongiae]